MDILAVKKSYARWAPIYDLTFGAITNHGRRRVVSYINTRGGTVLEVGVGTGLSLRNYSDNVDVTGVDYSREMLEKARKRQQDLALAPVKKLLEMDARKMSFADNSFDTVTAMHILSVVPDPEQVMAEIARVLKPGGQVVIANHFAHKTGFWAFAGKVCAPLYNLLGWHSDFDIATIMGQDSLLVKQKHSFPPFGMMTFLVLEKRAD